MYFVYVLFDRQEDKFYIGYTADIERRMGEHFAGKNHTTTRYSSKQLIFWECFIVEQDARRREGYFKTTKGRKALRLMLRETLKPTSNCPVV